MNFMIGNPVVVDADGFRNKIFLIDSYREPFVNVRDGGQKLSFHQDKVTPYHQSALCPTANRRKASKIMYRDRVTGEEYRVRQDFIDKLPAVLGMGESSAKLVADVLTELGVEVTENNRRQLREAKAFLMQERRLPICSLDSTNGGYFIAKSGSELLKDVEQKERTAKGILAEAAFKRALAAELFPSLAAA